MSTNGDDRGGIKAKNPDTYSGGSKDLERFIAQCQLYFMIMRKDFRSETEKVLFAGGHLRGPAADWFTPFIRDLSNNGSEKARKETRNIFAQFNNFEEELNRLYGNRDKQKAALRNIKQLRQGTSASQYTASFRRYALDSGLNEVGQMDFYYGGLKDSIKDEIARDDPAENLNELIDRAIRIDERFFERRLERGHIGAGYKANSGSQRKPYYGPQPMDLSATRGPLSQKDRDHRMKNNLCLYCGKAGHRANACKAKQSNAGGLAANRNYDPYEEQDEDGPPQYLRATRVTKPTKVKKPEQRPTLTRATRGGNLVRRGTSGAVKSGPPRSPTPYPAKEPEIPHSHYSWTGCYEDNCLIHLSEKQGSGWYPREKGKKPPSSCSDDHRSDLYNVGPSAPTATMVKPASDSHLEIAAILADMQTIENGTQSQDWKHHDDQSDAWESFDERKNLMLPTPLPAQESLPREETPDVLQWLSAVEEQPEDSSGPGDTTSTEANSSDTTSEAWEEQEFKFNAKKVHIVIPEDRTVSWRVNEGNIEILAEIGGSVQGDLISAWMNLNVIVSNNVGKANAARARSNERRRSQSLPRRLDDWKQVEEPTYTPTSSSTDSGSEQ